MKGDNTLATKEPFLHDVIIYHNPACGTSRNTLALIRNAGIEPHVVEYLKTPPSRVMLEHAVFIRKRSLSF